MVVPSPRHLRAVTEITSRPGDDDVLRAVARGDRDAFGELYDRYAPRVFGLVRKVVRDPSRSEEVTQDVFGEVWRTASRFDPDRGAARTWILTMAHRRAIDCVRSTQASRDRDERVGHRDRSPAFDETAEQVTTSIEHQQSATPWTTSPTCSARRSSSRTTAGAPTARSRSCSTPRSARSRPGCATG